MFRLFKKTKIDYFVVSNEIQYKQDVLRRLGERSDAIVFVGDFRFQSDGKIKIINAKPYSGTWDLFNYRIDDTYSESRSVNSWGNFLKYKQKIKLRISVNFGVITFENKFSNVRISKQDLNQILEWLKIHHREKKERINTKNGTWLSDAI
ncbi:MAG: hypothetical protein RLZZ37_835 [Actinomycetota bacterium]|jgi:hypothetical protein